MATQKQRLPIHEIGAQIINPLTNQVKTVTADWWNGKIEATDHFNRVEVMSVRQQRDWLDLEQVNAVRALIRFVVAVMTPVYEVTYVANQPEAVQNVAA